MANGDDAAAAGYPLVAGTDDRRNGWDQINLSRDLTARLGTELRGKPPTAHTHVTADITDRTSNPTPLTLVYRNAAGDFNVNTPTGSAHPATKAYVDSKVGPASTEANGPTDAAYARSATGSGFYAVWMNSSNQFMRNTSSRRYKRRIRPLDDALASVLALDPVTFELRDETVNGRFVGLIAEDVVGVFPEVITFDDEGRPDAIDYGALVAPLIGAIRELAARVKELEATRDS